MMLDLGPFSDEKFDAKRWVNSSCQSRHPQDSLEKRLVDSLEKLQITSEEIGASLEEQSGGALLRVPRATATRDVLRLRDDAVSLRGSVAGILQKLKKAEGSSADCIASLARVDNVKQRMEAAYKTLQDAAGLTQLSSMVEDVFTSGDLPRAAETLASMRNCLSAVGEVAEFVNVRKQLEMLEDRLEGMVQPRLTDALTYHKVDIAQDLRGILIRIGRFKSLELQYSKVRLKPIKQLWEDFDTKHRANKLASERSESQRLPSGDEFQFTSPQASFACWLPSFYDELLLYLEQEWKWCMIAFPDDYMTLVPKLSVETMGVLGASFVSRLNLATGDAVPETKALAKGVMDLLSGDLPKGINIQTKHLEALIELHNVTGSFARNIQHLFSDSELRVLIDTLKAVYSPFESFKQKYGNMERAILSSEIAVVDLRGAVTRGVGAQGIELSETVRRMEESIPQVVVLLEAAVERCIGFTGGSEADELILALDDILLQYISMLQETLKSLRVVCGVDGTGDGVCSKKDGSAEKRESSRKMDLTLNEEWFIVQGALQILTVADSLTSRSSVFEASLRATLARLNSSLSISLFGTNLDHNLSHLTSEQSTGDLSMAGRASLDVAAIRLVDVPEKAQKLLNLLKQSKDPRFHALPLASQRVAAFADTVNELVYDVLISKVRKRLGEVSRLPNLWRKFGRMTTISDLTWELVGEILSRVPFTSLRAVRSTCKSWNTLSKNLILGIKASRNHHQFLEFLVVDSRVSSLRFDLQGIHNEDKDDNLVDPSMKQISIPNNNQIEISQSQVYHCDGLLLCVTKDENSKLVVWNPYLGQTKLIQPRNQFHRFDRFAIGYDINRNHKILRFPYRNEGYGQRNRIDVYDLSSDSWRVLDVNPYSDEPFGHTGVSLKGNTYFFGQEVTTVQPETTEQEELADNRIIFNVC